MFFDLLMKYQAIQLVFNRAMNAAQLDTPDPWLRFFAVFGVRNQHYVLRLPLRHATAAETIQLKAALPNFAPGIQEFFISPPPPPSGEVNRDDITPLLFVDAARVQFNALVAVNDVSFTLRAGDLLGLIGPNGAG